MCQRLRNHRQHKVDKRRAISLPIRLLKGLVVLLLVFLDHTFQRQRQKQRAKGIMGEIFLMGVDVGAGSQKTTIIDSDGNVRGAAAWPVRTHAPKPGWSEQDPEDWWAALCRTAPAALREAGPWGQHFPEPMFHGVFQLVQQRIVGERHLKLVLKSECGSLSLDGIAFNIDRDLWPNPSVRWADLVYKLDVNEFRGRESVQLLVAHIAAR